MSLSDSSPIRIDQPVPERTEVIPGALRISTISKDDQSAVLGVEFGREVCDSLRLVSDAARDSDKKTGKSLPYLSLRAAIETSIPGIVHLSQDLGKPWLGGDQSGPFMLTLERDRRRILQILKTAFTVWVDVSLRPWMDSLGGFEPEDADDVADSIMKSQAVVFSFLPREAIDLGTLMREPGGFPRARQAIFGILSEALTGVELFEGMGPVHRVANRYSSDNSLEFETWPKLHRNTPWSMVAEYTVATIPGSTDIILKIRATRRRWMKGMPHPSRMAGMKRLSAHVLIQDGRYQAVVAQMPKEIATADGVSQEHDPAFVLAKLASSEFIEGSFHDLVSATRTLKKDIFVGIPYRTAYGSHPVGSGATTHDQIDLIDRTYERLKGFGFELFRDMESARVRSVKSLDNNPAWELKVLYAMVYGNEEEEKYLSQALNEVVRLDEETKEAGSVDELMRSSPDEPLAAILQRRKETAQKRLTRAYGNDAKIKLAVVGSSMDLAGFIHFCIKTMIVGDKDRIEVLFYSLPEKAHGPLREIFGPDDKSSMRERFQVQSSRWEGLAYSMHENSITHALVVAPMHYPGGKEDYPVNKYAGRATLASLGGVNVQYLRPYDDHTERELRSLKAPLKEFLYRMQSAIEDLLFGHAGAIDPYEEAIDEAFPDYKNRPDTLIGVTIIDQRRLQIARSTQGNKLLVAFRIDRDKGMTFARRGYVEDGVDGLSITEWVPLNEFLKRIAGQKSLAISDEGRRDDEIRNVQAFLKTVVDEVLDEGLTPLVMIDATNMRRSWKTIQNSPDMPPEISFPAFEDGDVGGSSKWDRVRLVRVDRREAGAILMRQRYRTTSEKRPISHKDTILPLLIKISEWKNGGYFWDTADYAGRGKRGLSAYRHVDMHGKVGTGDSAVYTIKSEAPIIGSPYRLPSVLEISVIRGLDRDDPMMIANAIHNLRKLFAHHSAEAALPAPLAFDTKITDYLSRFAYEDMDDDEVEAMSAAETAADDELNEVSGDGTAVRKVSIDPFTITAVAERFEKRSREVIKGSMDSAEMISVIDFNVSELGFAPSSLKSAASMSALEGILPPPVLLDPEEDEEAPLHGLSRNQRRFLRKREGKRTKSAVKAKSHKAPVTIASEEVEPPQPSSPVADHKQEEVVVPTKLEHRQEVDEMSDRNANDSVETIFRDLNDCKERLINAIIGFDKTPPQELRDIAGHIEALADRYETVLKSGVSALPIVQRVESISERLKEVSADLVEKCDQLISEAAASREASFANEIYDRCDALLNEATTLAIEAVRLQKEADKTTTDSSIHVSVRLTKATKIMEESTDNAMLAIQKIEEVIAFLPNDIPPPPMDDNEDLQDAEEEESTDDQAHQEDDKAADTDIVDLAQPTDEELPPEGYDDEIEDDDVSDLDLGDVAEDFSVPTEEDQQETSRETNLVRAKLAQFIQAGEFGMGYHLVKSLNIFEPRHGDIGITAAELKIAAQRGAVKNASSLNASHRMSEYNTLVEIAQQLSSGNSLDDDMLKARVLMLFVSSVEDALFGTVYGPQAITIISELAKNGIGSVFFDLVKVAEEAQRKGIQLHAADLARSNPQAIKSYQEDKRAEIQHRLTTFEVGRYNFQPALKVRTQLFMTGHIGKIKKAFRDNDPAAALKIVVHNFVDDTGSGGRLSEELIERHMDDMSIELGIDILNGDARIRVASQIRETCTLIQEWADLCDVGRARSHSEDQLKQILQKLLDAVSKTISQLDKRVHKEGATLAAVMRHSIAGLEQLKARLEGRENKSFEAERQLIAVYNPLFWIPNLHFADFWSPTPYDAPRILEALLDDQVPTREKRHDPDEIRHQIEQRIAERSFMAALLLVRMGVYLKVLDEPAALQMRELIEHTRRGALENSKSQVDELKRRVIRLHRYSAEIISQEQQGDDLSFVEAMVDDVAVIISNMSDAGRFSESASPTSSFHDDDLSETSVLGDNLSPLSDASALNRRIEDIRNRLDRLVEKPKQDLLQRAIESADVDNPESSPEFLRIKRLLDIGDLSTAKEILDNRELGEDGDELIGVVTPRLFDRYSEKFEDRIISEKLTTKDALTHLKERKNYGILTFSQVEEPEYAEEILTSWMHLRNIVSRNGKDIDKVLRAGCEMFAKMGVGIDHPNHENRKLTKTATGRYVFETTFRIERHSESILLPEFGTGTKDYWRICISDRMPDTGDIDIIGNEDLPSHAATLVVVLSQVGSKIREKAAIKTIANQQKVIVIDETLFLFALSSKRFRFLEMLEVAQAYAYSNPYRDYLGDETMPPELFVGREDEMNSVIRPNGGYYVYGGRRLGKTALLHYIRARRHDPENGILVAYIGMHETDSRELWEKASAQQQLKPIFSKSVKDANQFTSRIKKWLDEDTKRTVLLLIDESDRFLEYEAKDNHYKVLVELQDLLRSTGSRFKFVFAGLQKLARHVHLDNSPISHIDRDVIPIGPLSGASIKHGETLVTRPLAGMGYRFEHSEDVWRILNFCIYYPVHIQIFCKILVERLRDRVSKSSASINRVIESSLVETILDDIETLEEIRKTAIDKTLGVDNGRYKFLTLIAAKNAVDQGQRHVPDAGLNIKQYRGLAARHWPAAFNLDIVSDIEFQALLEEMQGMGLLRRTSSRRWTLRHPVFIRMLGGAEQIESDLVGYETKETPKTFDIGLRRSLVAVPKPFERNIRSPLTASMIYKLTKKEPAINLVFGLKVAGMDIVPYIIENSDLVKSAAEKNDLRIEVFRGHSVHDLVTQSLAPRRRSMGRRNIIIVPETRNWRPDWVRRALRTQPVINGAVQVIFLGGADHAWEWSKQERAVEMPPTNYDVMTVGPWKRVEAETYLKQSDASAPEEIAQRIYCDVGCWPIPMSSIFEAEMTNPRSFNRLIEAAKKEVIAATEDPADLGLRPDIIRVLYKVFETLSDKDHPFAFEEDAIDVALSCMEDPCSDLSESLIVSYLGHIGVLESARLGAKSKLHHIINPIAHARIMSLGGEDGMS